MFYADMPTLLNTRTHQRAQNPQPSQNGIRGFIRAVKDAFSSLSPQATTTSSPGTLDRYVKGNPDKIQFVKGLGDIQRGNVRIPQRKVSDAQLLTFLNTLGKNGNQI